MNKLSKEKRNQLILVVLITVAVLIGLWFGLINYQQEILQELTVKKIAAQGKLEKSEQGVKNAGRLETELAEATKKLADLEDDMAPGNPLSWMVNKIDVFKLPYKVDMPQISPPEPRTMELLAKFPYQQATFGIGGTAYYHDLGKFLADFENHFPYFRVLNLSLQPSTTAPENDREKLEFNMQVVTLVKPGAL